MRFKLSLRPEAFFPLRARTVGRYKVMPPPEPNRVAYPYVGRLHYQGLAINLEHLPGDVRRGKDPDGNPWAITMRGFYGEFADTLGADGDPIDVFVGPEPNAPNAYVVHQKVPGTTEHDEDKVLVGFNTKAEARAFYSEHYDGNGYWGGCTIWEIDELAEHLAQLHSNRRLDRSHELAKASNAGPFIGPRGGKWADPQHTVPWREGVPTDGKKLVSHYKQNWQKHGEAWPAAVHKAGQALYPDEWSEGEYRPSPHKHRYRGMERSPHDWLPVIHKAHDMLEEGREAAAAHNSKMESEEAEEKSRAAYESQGVEIDYSDPPKLSELRGKKVWLYHGTSTALLNKEQGLTPASEHGKKSNVGASAMEAANPNHVYLTAKPGGSGSAEFYAKNAASKHGGEPTVVRVLVNGDDLQPDPDDSDIRAGSHQYVVDRVSPEQIKEQDGERTEVGHDPAEHFDAHTEKLANPANRRKMLQTAAHVLTQHAEGVSKPMAKAMHDAMLIDMAKAWRRSDLVDELGDVIADALATTGAERLALLEVGFATLHKARKIAHQPGLHFDQRTHRWMRDQRAPKKQGGLFKQPTEADAAQHKPAPVPQHNYKPGKFKGHEGDRFQFKEQGTGRDDFDGQNELFGQEGQAKPQASEAQQRAQQVAVALKRTHNRLLGWDKRVGASSRVHRHTLHEQLSRIQDLFEHELRSVPRDDHAHDAGLVMVRTAVRRRQRQLLGDLTDMKRVARRGRGLSTEGPPSAEQLLAEHPMRKAEAGLGAVSAGAATGSGATAPGIADVVPEDLEDDDDDLELTELSEEERAERYTQLDKCVAARGAVLRAILVGDPTVSECNDITRLVVAGAPAWRAVDAVMFKSGPIKGRAGLHLDPMKHRWVRDTGQQMPANHKPTVGDMFDTKMAGRRKVVRVEGEHVHVSRVFDTGQESHPVKMHRDSLHQHINDMRHHAPPLDKPTGNKAIDAVAAGKGEFIGKGQDGLVFGIGDQVVKVSTTTPYQPDNPGHRTPEEAVAHLQKEHKAHAALKGIPMVQSIRGGYAGGRYWLSKPKLDMLDMSKKGALSAAELKQVADAMGQMHDRGWAMRDQIQMGRDADGGLWFSDLGQAVGDAKEAEREREDNHHLQHLYRAQGVPMFPTGAKLKSTVKRLERFRDMAGKNLDGGAEGPAHAKHIRRWADHAQALADELMSGDDDDFERSMSLMDEVSEWRKRL